MAKITRLTSSKYRIAKEQSKKLLMYLPVIAGLLFIVSVFFAKGFLKAPQNQSLPKTIVKQRIEIILNPMKLLSFYYESSYPEFKIPQDLLKSSLLYLKQTCDFSTVAIIDSKKFIHASFGSKTDIDLFKKQTKIFNSKVIIIPIIKRRNKKPTELIFSVPIQPRKSTSLWLIGKINIKTFSSHFPNFLSLQATARILKNPIHPNAPFLRVKINQLNRPIWPMLIGIIMIILGVLILIISPKWIEQHSEQYIDVRK